MTIKYTIQKNFHGETIMAEEEDQPIKFIPFDEGNMDYQAYLKWVEAGGVAAINDTTPAS